MFQELRPPRVHASVLMDNHYHLLLKTTEANLSRSAQWPNVRYPGKIRIVIAR